MKKSLFCSYKGKESKIIGISEEMVEINQKKPWRWWKMGMGRTQKVVENGYEQDMEVNNRFVASSVGVI